MAKTATKILDFVQAREIVTTKEIKKHIKLSDRAVYKQLAKLAKDGELHKFGQPPHVFYKVATKDITKEKAVANISKFKITKQMQIKELTNRVTPVLNVDVMVYKNGKFLVGRRSAKKSKTFHGYYLFPGGRMKYYETPQESAYRILKTELPGVKANLRRLLTAIAPLGSDPRAHGVTLFYLFDYISGNPMPNFQLDEFKWVTKEEMLKSANFYWVDKEVMLGIDKAIREMHSNMEELLVEVDKQDRRIGQITKRSAHSTTQRSHRAAHIMVFTTKGELVLHQRSLNKDQAPGMWDMFGGHQVIGQIIEQTAQSELAEELGVDCKLTFFKKNLYQTERQSEFAYLYWGASDGPYGFDKNEVEKIGTFDCVKLLKGDYDKDFDIIPHVKIYVQDLRCIWEKLK